MRFATVLVVGAGQMGTGIAQVVATSGRRVVLVDPAEGALERAVAAIGTGLDKLAARGASVLPEEVLARIECSDALVEADLLIEAIVEDRNEKEELAPPR